MEIFREKILLNRPFLFYLSQSNTLRCCTCACIKLKVLFNLDKTILLHAAYDIRIHARHKMQHKNTNGEKNYPPIPMSRD